MRKKKKQILVIISISVFMAMTLLVSRLTYADEEKIPKPLDPIVTMLDEIYDIVLDTNTKVTPAPCTGAPVPKTGQKAIYAPGDDGELKKGVAWPNPRFTDNGNGTVTDNLTGLIWLKNANCFGELTWIDALSACNTLASPVCGLTDDSAAGDWRLPNIKELESLIHYGVHDPALPNTIGDGKWSEGDAFTGVPCNVANCSQGYYWSSNTAAGSGDGIYLYFGGGFVQSVSKTHDGFNVWPVRGGN